MYSLIAQLFEPYTFLLLGLTALMIYSCWRTAPRRRFLTIAVALLLLLNVLSTRFISGLALRSLESPFPATEGIPESTDTIVVLGGSLVTESIAEARVRLGTTSVTRCLYAARLYRKAGRCRVIVAGGHMSPLLPNATLAAAMRDFLVEVGVNAVDITLEPDSTTTWENAVNVKPLLERDGRSRVWLVTEATHMRRSAQCFRAQQIDVVPAPCAHRALLMSLGPGSFLPTSTGIAQVDEVVHEWLGIAWYRLRGRY